MGVIRGIAIATCLASAPSAPAVAQDLVEEILGYMDFATESEGIILPEQLSEDIFAGIYFVDARSPEDHAAGTIPGAVNIDWRQIPSRLDELPETGTVVLFCNTGVRSSQATFAARVMGRSNVLVLQSGYEGWLKNAAYRPE